MTKQTIRGIIKAIKEIDKTCFDLSMPSNMKHKEKVFKARRMLWNELDKAGINFDRKYKIIKKGGQC